MRLSKPTIAVLLVVLAAARIASTWRVYSATADEATHTGAGLELLESHKYELQRYNPPLPRVVFAIWPYASGMRFVPVGDFGQQLHSVFYGHGDYRDNLMRARAGNLVFFIIAAIAVWFLAGEHALIALLLFTMEPLVLGYSSLVTHDTPAVAGVAVAMLAFDRWMKNPGWRRALLFGAAYGFAILCKFSCIAFVPLICGVLWLFNRKSIWTLFASLPAAALTIWAGYGFTITAFINGVRSIVALDKEGFAAYAIGRFTMHGWWWYFPLALVLKTTLPLLALFAIALFDRSPYAFASLALLAITLNSSLDIGVRYVLPIYVPMAIAGAAVAAKHKFAYCLVIAQMIVSLFAHPDYFPYFNVIAGRDPSYYLIDSNLDWGQDVLRLRAALRKQHIDEIGLSLFGPADYDALHFPKHYEANPWHPARGWIAVSDFSYRMTMTKDGGWLWLKDKPYQRIGKSIRLYDLR